MSIHNGSSSEVFKKLFGYSEKIKNIDESISRLYQLANTPESKEAIIEDAAQLVETKNYLLKQQARFMSFISTLDPLEVKVLKMRCEENNAWKKISAELHISDTTAKRILIKITESAEKYGGFF